MKCLMKSQDAPGLTLTSAPEPQIGPNDVLIAVGKTAICGTDLHIYKWDDWARSTIPIPMTVGHEFSGKIVEIGASVSGLKVGQRVSGEGHITCGKCKACRTGQRHLCQNTKGVGVNRTGAFAEFIALPAQNVFPLSNAISDEVAALFDPLGNAVHTVLAQSIVAEDVLITGAGPIGCMAAAVAKLAGARTVTVTDINPSRLVMAKRLGATEVVDVSQTSLNEVREKLAIHEGFGVGLEMSGANDALNAMLEHSSHGASISLLGFLPKDAAIDWASVIFKCLKIQGIYGRKIFETWYQMEGLLTAGLDVSPIITHEIPARDYDDGFQALLDGKASKVLLDWQSI